MSAGKPQNANTTGCFSNPAKVLKSVAKPLVIPKDQLITEFSIPVSDSRGPCQESSLEVPASTSRSPQTLKIDAIESKIQKFYLKLSRTRQISAGLPNQVDQLNINQRGMLGQVQSYRRSWAATASADVQVVHTYSKVRERYYRLTAF